jgi:hypothetical protein
MFDRKPVPTFAETTYEVKARRIHRDLEHLTTQAKNQAYTKAILYVDDNARR